MRNTTEDAAGALLTAGAVLPRATLAGDDVDTLTARAYTHPALDGRTVVRLVPGTLGEAEDLAMDFLGLAREPEVREVGQVRRETLGFPAWALANDPANGHRALALVKDIERLARKAAARPGTAKDGFDALGERLARSVPHFLPTYYEQVARVFLGRRNTVYAAMFFDKAREAERRYGLEVDEDRQRAVFLEFAFAGALSVTALKWYARDLGSRLAPAEAWRRYRRLVVERCAAGVPPHGSLPQDTRAMIRAAGLDRGGAERALVADLLVSRAVAWAPAGFWTSYRAAIVELCRRDPALRPRLLEIMPARLRPAVDDEFWLGLLADSGADRLLTGEATSPAHDRAGGADGVDPADWLNRWIRHRGTVFGGMEPTIALVARMAPRLRDLGRPVDLTVGAGMLARVDADLLDLCVVERVPVAHLAANDQPLVVRHRRPPETVPDPHRPDHGDDYTLYKATAGLADLRVPVRGMPCWHMLHQIRAVNRVLSGGATDGRPLASSARLGGPGEAWTSDAYAVPDIEGYEPWPAALDALRPLAYRATSPAQPEAWRQGLLLLLEAIGEGPLASVEGTLREVYMAEPHGAGNRTGQVLRCAGRTVVILGRAEALPGAERVAGQASWVAVDHDPSRAFGKIAHFTLTRGAAPTAVGLAAGELATVTRLARKRGAAPWSADAPASLVVATGGGLGPAQAALLLAAMPEELTAEAASAMGLKPGQKKLGATLLGSLRIEDRRALMGALLPRETARLWESGPDVEAAGHLWRRRLGDLLRLPEALAAALASAGLVDSRGLEQVLNPARTPWISRTTMQRPAQDGRLTADESSAVPDLDDIVAAVEALIGLGYHLPSRHPLRAALPAALRRRLADPELLVRVGIDWTERSKPIVKKLRGAHGLSACGGADHNGVVRLGSAIEVRHWNPYEEVWLRPAALTGPDDPAFGLLDSLLAISGTSLRAVPLMLGDALGRVFGAADVSDQPSRYAQDPTLSAPGLVAEVARAHGLGEDAAALYLQLLALPDPTDRNRARWTGWKLARMKKAHAELAGTDLVIEAKRPRAGRSLFLPGGWLDLKAPALPVESWKRGLYLISEDARTAPVEPVAELFARAWKRLGSGDVPGYREPTTPQRYRPGSS